MGSLLSLNELVFLLILNVQIQRTVTIFEAVVSNVKNIIITKKNSLP